MNAFDFFIIVFLLLGGFAGFQKGLITGVARFVGKIAAIVIAVIFHKQFLNTLDPVLGIRESIEPKIGAFLDKVMEGKITAGGEQFNNADSLVQPVIGEATIVLTDYVLKIGSILVLFMLTAIIINLFIAVIISPLAKSLGVVNRGGGLVFGVLGTIVGLCLVIGMIAPFLTATSVLKISDSLLYPWIIEGFDVISSMISAFAGDFLVNPLEAFPLLKETLV